MLQKRASTDKNAMNGELDLNYFNWYVSLCSTNKLTTKVA